MNLQALRRSLAETIQQGVNRPVNVYAYMPDSPRFPCVVITPAPDYRSAQETFYDDPSYTVNFDVLVGAGGRAEDAQILLDDMLSNGTDTISSLEDAIYAGKTSDGYLDGLAMDVVVGAASVLNPGAPNAEVFAASVRVTVYTKK